MGQVGYTSPLLAHSGVTTFNGRSGAVVLLTSDVNAVLSSTNAVTISPTGGSGTVTINPAVASTMDNVVIGGSTPLAGHFTTVTANTSVTTPLITTAAASGPTITTPAFGAGVAGVGINATPVANAGLTANTAFFNGAFPGGIGTAGVGIDVSGSTGRISNGTTGGINFYTNGMANELQVQILRTATPTNALTLTGGTNPTIGTSAGSLAITPATLCAGSVTAKSGTAIPAGGTAGAGLMVSSAPNFGVFFGSGAPSLSAAKGSLYLRSDGSGINDRMYVNTDGGTTWTAVATIA